jgi:hypothetical protein
MNFTRNIAALGLFSAAALTIAPNAQAASIFGIEGIKFDTKTTVNFSFKSEIGKFVSTLGVYDTSGTLLKTLFGEESGASESFDFLAGIEYKLGLESVLGGNDKGTVFSTGTGSDQNAIFFGCGEGFADANCALDFAGSEGNELASFSGLDGEGFADLLLSGETVFISFDDDGNNLDKDFQDFTVTAKAAVPEPASVVGLMAIGAAALKLRRRNDA